MSRYAPPRDPTTTTKTFCRLCEVGLRARRPHRRRTATLVELRPDHDHPVTQGFACSNGLLAADVHRDPRPPAASATARRATPSSTSRGTTPPRRSPRACAPSSTSTARAPSVSTSATRTRSTRWSRVGAIQFIRTLGSDRVFSSASQDCSNKYATAELLYGVAQANPIPDLERTELLLVIGANPRVSKTSFLSVADPVQALRDIRDRGGRVVFVNPLRIEPDIGETLQLRPDTDPYLLAAMLHEIDRTVGLLASARSTATSSASTTCARSCARTPPPRWRRSSASRPSRSPSSRATSPPPNGASIHVSTGLNMGRQGSLAYWLAQMLLLLTGNLDRPGGNYFAGARLPDRRRRRSTAPSSRSCRPSGVRTARRSA